MESKSRRSIRGTTWAFTFELQLDRDSAIPGETITGRVRISDVNYTKLLDRVEVGLSSRLPGWGWGTHAEMGWQSLQITPGELRELEFSVHVPEQAASALDNRVFCSVDYGEDDHYRIQMAITVPLAECYQQLAACLSSITRVPVTEWVLASHGDALVARLIPTGAARDLFDELQLEIYRSGPGFYGELVIDPCERTLADRLKAKVGADRRRYPYRFRSATSEQVPAFFKQCLRPYLDAVRHLPIPAPRPETPIGTLPRPASATDEEPAG